MKGTIICDICAKVFYSKDSHKRHQIHVHEGKPHSSALICDICGQGTRPYSRPDKVFLKYISTE